MESVIFSDYRLIADFADKCQNDIEGNACGHVRRQLHSDSNVIFYHHSQGLVLECLQKMIDVVEPQCKEEMLRISELQVKLMNSELFTDLIFNVNTYNITLLSRVMTTTLIVHCTLLAKTITKIYAKM